MPSPPPSPPPPPSSPSHLLLLTLAILSLPCHATPRHLRVGDQPQESAVVMMDKGVPHNWQADLTPLPDGVCKQWPAQVIETQFRHNSTCGDTLSQIVSEGVSNDLLHGFCKTGCGQNYTKEMNDWRSWCDEERALRLDWADHNISVVHHDPNMPFGWMKPHLLGCTKDPLSGMYCSLWWAEHVQRGGNCTYWESCCWSEVRRIFHYLEKSEPFHCCPNATKLPMTLCDQEQQAAVAPARLP